MPRRRAERKGRRRRRDHYHAGPSEDMKRAMDATLRRLARMLERRPENAPGTDKAWVLRAMWQRLLFLREVRQARRVDRR